MLRYSGQLAFAVLILFAGSVVAQTPSSTTGVPASRAELMEQARVADSLGRKEEAFLLRTRLRDGDFDVGDQILVTYEGPGLNKPLDTLVVRAGRILRLEPPMGDLDLTGMLRFELADSLTARANRYFKNEVVHATPLIRVAYTSPSRTGFVFSRPDMLLSDVIARANVQDATANWSGVMIRRNQQLLWGPADVQAALTNGVTVEQLGLQSGDEIAIPVRQASHGAMIVQIGLTLLTAIMIPILLRR